MSDRNIDLLVISHELSPRGVGYARNRAVEKSSGKFLCFLDVDDVMHQDRLTKQYHAALSFDNMIVGSRFHREPEGSTERFTKWANEIPHDKLMTQIYTSHGPTVIMPTWFCSRDVFDKVGGFDEGGRGVPEDLIFFYKHLDLGGTVMRIDEDLMMYRYHETSATFSVTSEEIDKIRLEHLEKNVLSKLSAFTIWNAGKSGKKFFRSLSSESQGKVKAFCDVDDKKIDKGFYTYEYSKSKVKPKIPIMHFKQATPPLIICVKLDLTEGKFEENLASLNLEEGTDYFIFN